MPHPEPRPALVQAPAWAGVGLEFRPREPDPSWPEDWWQRTYETLDEELEPGPPPLTERQMRIPPPPPP
jgi:hypothetical protein